MRIALVHDYLCGIGGSERVFQYLCEEFKEADVYTLSFNPAKTLPYFKNIKINTTWLNKYVQSREAFKWSFPLATYAMEAIDLNEYDLVLSSSATVAKYVRVPNGIHICYCYIPTRALWQFDEYFGKSIKIQFLKFIIPLLKKRDYKAAKRVNHFIAISNSSKEFIRKFYNRDSTVIYSPIDLEKFRVSSFKKNHFLIVSRLEHWKKIDYAIQAFNTMNLPLRIIGTGKDEKRLKDMAKSNIEFLGEVDDNTLIREYSKAKAVIFTPELEYGLIPLESIACGTPVVCYGKGGVEETMIPWESNNSKATSTAIYFYEQTPESLIEAIHKFEKASFNTQALVKHSLEWSVSEFKQKIRLYIDSILEDKKLTV